MQTAEVESPARQFLPPRSFIETVVSSRSATFDRVRRDAFEKLRQLADLTGSEELWRYTKPELFPWHELLSESSLELSIGNGGPREGVSIGSLDEAKDLEKVFGVLNADLAENVAALFQLAAVQSSAAISVRGQQKDPVVLSSLISQAGRAGASLVVITVESGAQALIVEDLAWSDFHGFYAPRIEVIVRPNAQCEFVSCQRLSSEGVYLARHRFHLFRDANLRTAHVSLGARVSRLDLDCKLYEPGANADLYSLYLARGEQHLDYHPTQAHIAPHCRSNLYSKGAILDQARSVYFGFIRVGEEAQKTDAYQTNRNLLLTPDGRADAIPNLEIKANDVKCSHGASVSQVGGDELFYLMTRGLPRAAAERLLVEGFFEDLVQKISNDWVREFVASAVMKKLGTL